MTRAKKAEGPSKKPTTPEVRCAIYTRKSTEERLDLEYNSLDAQRDAALAYIASQQGEGWVVVDEQYDDGGFSGGNADRPALQRLLEDIKAGKIDCVVVYKVDRLSRSLLDFARIMGTFDEHSVAFVSVTQQFNTSTPMGRRTADPRLRRRPDGPQPETGRECHRGLAGGAAVGHLSPSDAPETRSGARIPRSGRPRQFTKKPSLREPIASARHM